MGAHRRREIEVIRDILKVCLRGANKTKIVYHANLNFTRLSMYLRMLLSFGFVSEVDTPSGTIIYKTTKDGVDFLNRCLKMQSRLGKVPVTVRSRARLEPLI